jgi:hypothetical protein
MLTARGNLLAELRAEVERLVPEMGLVRCRRHVKTDQGAATEN